MKRMLILLMLLMVVTTVVVMVGCSDDDNGDGTIVGNVNDTSFQAIADVADGAADLHVDLIAANLALVQDFQTAPGRSDLGRMATADITRDVEILSSTSSYDAGSGWHTISFEAQSTHSEDGGSNIISIVGTDSLRFTIGGGSHPEYIGGLSSLEQVEFRSQVLFSGDQPDVYDTSSYVLTGDFPDLIMVNGSGHGYFEEASGLGTCGFTGHYSQTFNSIPLDSAIVYYGDGCPASGSVGLNINLTADCPDGVDPTPDMALGNWTVTLGFSGGQIHVTANNGTTTWTYTDWCGPDPTNISEADSAFVDDVIGERLSGFFYDIPITEALLQSVWDTPPRVARPQQGLQDYDTIVVNVTNPTYSNGWWTLQFTADIISSNPADTTYLSGVDSVRVYEGGIAVMEPANKDSVQEFDIRVHAVWYNHDESHPSEGKLQHRVDYVAVNVGNSRYAQGNGTIIDSTTYSEIGIEYSCDYEVNSSQTLTNLTFDPGSPGCPIDGQVAATATIATDCTGGGNDFYDAQGNWMVTADANGDGTVTITFNNGYYGWTRTENCGGGK